MEEISIYHLLWIVPLSVMLGAFLMALMVSLGDHDDRD